MSERYRKMLMFNGAYDNEEVNDFEDKSSYLESVLRTNSTSKPANRANLWETSLAANGNLGCTVLSREQPRYESISAERRNTVCHFVQQPTLGGHVGPRVTGVTPSPSQNIRGHFRSPDIMGRRT